MTMSLNPDQATLPAADAPITLARLNELLAAKTDAVGGVFADEAFPGLPSANDFIVGKATLAAFGCPMDGKTSDVPGLQALVNMAEQVTINGLPRITIIVPPNTDLYFGETLQTGACAMTLKGYGKDSSRIIMGEGVPGVLQHGSVGSPARYPLQVEEIGFVDSNQSGSGSACISAYFNWETTELPTTFVMRNVQFRYFTQATWTCDAGRDILWDNVEAEGPDGVMQQKGAFYFTTSPSNGFGSFTGVFKACRTVNYLYGWDYWSNVQLEGQRFYSCTSYSGGGFCRAYLNPSTEGVTNYRSPIWYFHDCDHQGYFFALDLYGCRDVLVDAGFFILNTMGSGITIPASPDGIARTHRSWMSFRSCYAVRLRDVEFDSNGSSGSTTTGVYVDGTTNYFRSDRANVLVGDTIAGFWEWDARVATNVCYEHDTLWGSWPEANNANKILDASNNQPAESFLVDEACGEVRWNGHYFLRFGFTNLTTDSNGRLTIPFPTRPNGKPFLIAGTPVAGYSIIKSEASGVPNNWIYAWSSTEIVVQFEGDTGGTPYSGMCLVDGF